MNYTMTSRDGFLDVETHGDADRGGLMAMIADILSHPNWAKAGAIFLNHSDLNSNPLTVDDIHSTAREVGRLREQFGQARVAVLVRRDVEFGMVRMWETIASNNWDATLRCFRSRDEAMLWLISP
jgi:hypothetical protein